MCVSVPKEPPPREHANSLEAETFTSIVIMYLNMLRDRLVASGRKLMTDLHLYEMMDEAAIYLAQHPILTVVVIAVAISCGIPVLMFVVFAILTVLFTFAGFIVIEGTLLTVGSVLLCGFVLAILIILVTIAATVGVAYLGFIEVYGLLQNSPENSALAHFLPRKSATQHPTISSTAQNLHED
ncbi:Protein of unknown function [Gryllus bimaculatus]|nr:Protein of unknown function [Gryllus bimaculatus]